ncbi:MAG: hypothetical protein RIE56_11615, partial [Amphiplicatus sp.]
MLSEITHMNEAKRRLSIQFWTAFISQMFQNRAHAAIARRSKTTPPHTFLRPNPNPKSTWGAYTLGKIRHFRTISADTHKSSIRIKADQNDWDGTQSFPPKVIDAPRQAHEAVLKIIGVIILRQL